MIAVTGSGGQLGSALVRLLGDGVMALSHRDLDISQTDQVAEWLGKHHPEVVINCAAYNAVDAAETDEEGARRVNAIAVGQLAGLCAGIGARFVTFSTDYVFDGSKSGGYMESDRPAPLSAYGRSKLEGENLALANNPESLVIRTSGLLSATHDNFATRILDALTRGPVRVVNDQVGCPTSVDALAPATLGAVEAGVTGLLHLAGAEAMTWFDLARLIAISAGMPGDGVEPFASSDLPRPAQRPKSSILASERLEDVGLTPLPSIGADLDRLVHQLKARR